LGADLDKLKVNLKDVCELQNKYANRELTSTEFHQ